MNMKTSVAIHRSGNERQLTFSIPRDLGVKLFGSASHAKILGGSFASGELTIEPTPYAPRSRRDHVRISRWTNVKGQITRIKLHLTEEHIGMEGYLAARPFAGFSLIEDDGTPRVRITTRALVSVMQPVSVGGVAATPSTALTVAPKTAMTPRQYLARKCDDLNEILAKVDKFRERFAQYHVVYEKGRFVSARSL